MVNGRKLEDELQNIEKFFQDMSIEDFDSMLIECGAGEGFQSNYVLTKSIIYHGKSYINYASDHNINNNIKIPNDKFNGYLTDLEVA